MLRKNFLLRTSVYYHKLITGTAHGFVTGLLRGLLYLVSLVYGMVMLGRNFFYDKRFLSSYTADVPVISVGNVTLGGTGKTPFVCWLSQVLLEHGYKVGLVSRGYKKLNDEDGSGERHNDEYLEMLIKLPDVPHFQSPNRADACRRMLTANKLDCVILDDAFQHRKVNRQLDIVLIDATEPDGLGYIFPRGTCREPMSSLKRADVLLLSRADSVDANERARLREKLTALSPKAVYGEIVHRPVNVVSFGEKVTRQPVSMLKERKIFAFNGIGNPDAFERTLVQTGAEINGSKVFFDHHHYDESDIQHLADAAKKTNAEMIVTTMKDIVKIKREKIGDIPLYAIEIGIEFLNEEESRCITKAVLGTQVSR
ncbi:MAG: tetraacyldisaccharide 4'-kinase [Planctomycetaceae bacterium]|jgi:tetraacyldisaccharide 4'-kinase|nr:tetraacyldisaccharide 4'-kinase [Planctomycetaceae bacterium]